MLNVTRFMREVGAGVANGWWHRKTDIEHTSGLRELLIHTLTFTEVGVSILLGMLCRINAGSLLATFGAAFAREGTAVRGVDVAMSRRGPRPGQPADSAGSAALEYSVCTSVWCLLC